MKEIRYLVKQTSYATLENRNFIGQELITYFGKDQKLLGAKGSHAKATHFEQELHPCMIREYGYKRECDAKKSWIYNNPENSEWWYSQVEIIAFEVEY